MKATALQLGRLWRIILAYCAQPLEALGEARNLSGAPEEDPWPCAYIAGTSSDRGDLCDSLAESIERGSLLSERGREGSWPAAKDWAHGRFQI